MIISTDGVAGNVVAMGAIGAGALLAVGAAAFFIGRARKASNAASKEASDGTVLQKPPGGTITDQHL